DLEQLHRLRLGAILWECPALVRIFPHDRAVQDATFSPDGRRVATASSDGTARVWDMETGEPLTAPLRHGGEVGRAVFSSDGQWLVTSSTDKATEASARVWEVHTGKRISTLTH